MLQIKNIKNYIFNNYFEQALSLMREGYIINLDIPGDDLSSGRWELADEEENV